MPRSHGKVEPQVTKQQTKNEPIHPSALPMVCENRRLRKWEFAKDSYYRRLSVRECARIQTFPDNFKFVYSDVRDGYKMVGNAVPPRLAECLAQSIAKLFKFNAEVEIKPKNKVDNILVGYYKDAKQLELTIVSKTYYTRAKYASSIKDVRYLLLHNGNDRMLFELQTSNPYPISKQELLQLGFAPHSNNYIAVKILKQIQIDGFDIYGLKITNKAPYTISVNLKK